jgi:HPt (histidine-containing phosphotransfer) domain-containing protein
VTSEVMQQLNQPYPANVFRLIIHSRVCFTGAALAWPGKVRATCRARKGVRKCHSQSQKNALEDRSQMRRKEYRNHELSGDGKINDADMTARAIDLSVLVSLEEAQGDGEPDLIVDLIDLYLDEVPRRLAAMSALLAQRDWLSLSRAAHSLKGCSAVLGAGRIPQLCEAVEQFALDHAHPVSLNVLHELHEEFALVRGAFLHEKQRRTSIRSNAQSNVKS